MKKFLLFSICLLAGCDPLVKSNLLIGVWKGETKFGYYQQLTITKIDAGIICNYQAWPKETGSDISRNIQFPIVQNKDGSWVGEYHGAYGLVLVDGTFIFKVQGGKLIETHHFVIRGGQTFDETINYKKQS